MRVQLLLLLPVVLQLGCPRAMTEDPDGLPEFQNDMTPSKRDGPMPDLTTGCLTVSGDGGTSDGGTCLPNDPDGPIVTFILPTANQLVPGKTLNATVKVTLRPMERSINTVTLFILGTKTTTPMALTAMADTYIGTVEIASMPSGETTLGATAVDLDGRSGSSTLVFVRDAGPKITIYSPKNTTYRGAAPVLFSVANPTIDTRFDVDEASVTAEVQMVTIPVTLILNQSPATWNGTIDFHAKAFGQALSGDQVLTVTAKNKGGTVSQATVQFTVDETGPDIVITKPKLGAFIGGVISIEATISDPSGVNDQSVLAIFGGDLTHSKTLTPVGNGMMSTDKYSVQFDTGTLPYNFVLPILSIRATDKLGNQGEYSEEVIVDNVNPAIDLDPPEDMHVRRLTDLACSHPFDPVGDESVDEGDIVHQLSWVHARIEDRGNTALGQTVVFISLVDDARVKLYFIRASDAPLIVDSDGDGICDDINPDLVPSNIITMAKQAVVLPMQAIPVIGSPDFTLGMPDNVCDPVGSAADNIVPRPLCGLSGTTITYNLGYSEKQHVPATFGIGPIDTPPSLICQGLQFDAANSIPDGEICVAVRAYDKAGNRNVSKVLHACLEKTTTQVCNRSNYQVHKAGRIMNATRPDCTGTVVNGVVDGTKKCIPGVKLNTGQRIEAYLPGSAPYPF